ncbi:virulence factor Mce-like protein [Herbihabitans rhizosphaerae]|uniref:Virulence factor Mce-like protein n=1 Tax=Herbihabitans rhizosphaerae TaxID=1872711 RepID=A0A4Q7KDG8_9PSEU|nr:MCE family protein [Herbihabitans rhizosphaerae]RZS31227.1 virulence factor Mce-like protein [Herbihabitans rhizosphaerae]
MNRFSLALRGIAGLLIVAVIAVLVIAKGAGAFDDRPTVTAVVPARSAGIAAQSTVEHHGVVVGTVTEVHTTATTSTLTIRLADDQIDAIPATVRARVLPRTLFGDQYVDLVAPPGESAALRAGTTVPADDSAQTIALNDAYERLYTVLKQIEPAKINTALAAVAGVLGGRGARFGDMIDQAHSLVRDGQSIVDTLGEDLAFTADLAEQLRTAAPDLWRTLDNAIVTSRTIVDKRGGLAAMVTGGIELMGEGEKLLRDNKDRAIQLIRAGDPVLDVLHAQRGAIPEIIGGLKSLVDAAQPVFSTGPWLKLSANITLVQPYPYTSADCPRYGDLAGPNCGRAPTARPPAPAPMSAPPPSFGGTSGPVGSPAERSALEELVRRTVPPRTNPLPAGLMGIFLGPIVRGMRMVMP